MEGGVQSRRGSAADGRLVQRIAGGPGGVSGKLPTCRACSGGRLQLVLSLGRTPLANALLTEDQLVGQEATYPLDLVFCPSCTLLQITETVPPERLFGEYLYFSSVSESMLPHAPELVEQMLNARSLNASSRAVELASNDGYLLQYYVRH